MNKNSQKNNKKNVLRKCIIKKEHFDKKDLIRIVRTPDGHILVDLSGKINGRGSYISKSEEVINDPKLKFKIQAALKSKINDEEFLDILDELKKGV